MKEEEFLNKHKRLVLKTHADMNQYGEKVIEDWSPEEFRHFVLAQINQLYVKIADEAEKEKPLIQVV